MTMLRQLALAAVLVLGTDYVSAQDLEKGLQLQSAQDFERALQELSHSSDQGHKQQVDTFSTGQPISSGYAKEQPTLGEVIFLNNSIFFTPIFENIYYLIKYDASKDYAFNWENCVIGYEIYSVKISRSVSIEHCEAIKSQIDRNLLASERLMQASLSQRIFAFMLNPIVLFSMMGAIYVYNQKIQNFLNVIRQHFTPKITSSIASIQFQLGKSQEKLKTRASIFGTSVGNIQASASSGFAEAQNKMGLSFKNGTGVLQDFLEAIKWFRLAAVQGHPQAQFNLGKMYAEGAGVPKDLKEAFILFSLAAKSGMADAQFELGTMLADGSGKTHDNIQAHMWYNLASANGNEKSATFRDDLAAKMTREEIAKAQGMAQDCLSSGYKNCGD